MINTQEITEELKIGFLDQNCKIFYSEIDKKQILLHYKECIDAIANLDEETALKKCKLLAKLKLLQYTPYTIIFNELAFIQSRILDSLLINDNAVQLHTFCKLFKNIENQFAKIFLTEYIKELKRKNNIRLSSINIFKEKNIIKYYTEHIVWLDNLADAIEKSNLNIFPIIDPKLCNFGKWLNTNAKLTISNNSQHKTLALSHLALHRLADKIYSLLRDKDTIEYLSILNMLKKCETISMDIGIELSFIKSSEYIQQAHYDKLTNMLNRNYLDDIYSSVFKMSKITNKPFCICMCDIDDFKHVNDTYGHDCGDVVLKTFADFLKNIFRDSDHIIRYGGEEFLIIFPVTKLHNAKETIEKCIKNLAKLEIKTRTDIIHITVSFGLIEINPNDSDRYEFDIENSIHMVDQKLYEAKRNGKNRVQT